MIGNLAFHAATIQCISDDASRTSAAIQEMPDRCAHALGEPAGERALRSLIRQSSCFKANAQIVGSLTRQKEGRASDNRQVRRRVDQVVAWPAS
jgi:hypothetical protein